MKQSVCALLFNEQNEVLVVSRKDNPDDFGLPGGKVEGRESPSDAIIRELWEEIHVQHSRATPPKVVFQCKEGIYECITFICQLAEGEHSFVPEEGCVIKWMTWDELCSQGSFMEYNIKLRKSYESRSNRP